MITYTCDYCGKEIKKLGNVCAMQIQEVAIEGQGGITTLGRKEEVGLLIHMHNECYLQMLERIKRIKQEEK